MPPLLFKSLSITRMPGFPGGIKSFKDLAGHINIIAGPNASGKSSTACMIQNLIWRRAQRGIQAESALQTGSDHWDVKLDGSLCTSQKNGNEEELTGIPGPDTSGRYMLALHELVMEDDRGLARQIIQESMGGFDLDLAANRLNYSETYRSKNIQEYREFEKAQQKVSEVNQQQELLTRKEEQLESLNRKKKEARDAALMQTLYESYRDFLEAHRKHESLALQISKMPASLNHATGEEYETVSELEKDIRDAEYAIENARAELKRNEETVAALDLPDAGIDPAAMLELGSRVDKLAAMARNIDDKRKQSVSFRARAMEELKGIRAHTDLSDWKGVELDDVTGLDTFLLHAQQVYGKRQFLMDKIAYLESKLESQNSLPDAGTLREGVSLLGRWLKKEGKQRSLPVVLLAVLLVSIVSTVLASWLIGWPGLLGLPLIAVLLWLTFKMKHGDPTSDYVVDYTQTGLLLPELWKPEEVSMLMDDLVKLLEQARNVQSIQEEREQKMRELAQLEPQFDKIREQQSQWLEKLKLVPDISESTLMNYSAMYHFLTQVREWKKYMVEATEIEAVLEDITTSYDDVLNKANKLIEDHLLKGSAKKLTDHTEAEAVYKDLLNKQNTFLSAKSDIQHQQEIISGKEQLLARSREKLESVYDKLGVQYGDSSEVLYLMSQLSQFIEVKRNLEYASRQKDDKEHILKSHTLYKDHKEELGKYELDEVILKIQDYAALYAELEDISKEITSIETKITQARESNDIELALAGRETALANLQEVFADNLASVTGKLIINNLKSQNREQNRSKVFVRADELIGLITQGRYSLRLGGDGDSFRAYDHVLSQGLELDQLSTGTRIQLLLAVRLAFIESQETGIRLPVLADELLANSDDTRAKAIIEALLEIAGQGRQIFYFTAQADEVAKWKTTLDHQKDLAHKLFILGDQEHEYNQRIRSKPFSEGIALTSEAPPPGKKDDAAYAKVLNVPAFDFISGTSSQLHLWYLLDDTSLLYNCLLKGIRYWGQLKNYTRLGGKINGLSGDLLARLDKKAGLLDKFCDLYRIGRSKPLDREVLEASGAVSEKFMDQVLEKMKMVNYDPKALLEALQNKEVPGFRENKLSELSDYLYDQGYTDNNEPMNYEEIVLHLHSYLSAGELDVADAENFLNRVLSCGKHLP
ncbi:MAG: hypothetical protein RG741_06490 [Bacteroidales bacterium]|nr:hypothetical protein [Bacteroidales bacterium]